MHTCWTLPRVRVEKAASLQSTCSRPSSLNPTFRSCTVPNRAAPRLNGFEEAPAASHVMERPNSMASNSTLKLLQ